MDIFYGYIYGYIYWATPMEPNFLRFNRGIDATQQGTKELSQAISSGEL